MGMKAIGLLFAAAAALCIADTEPSELQIRAAFQQALNNPVRGVLIAPLQGEPGMLLHGDTTELRALRKLGCTRVPVSAYVCDFFVELRSNGETVRRTVSGYFLDGPATLTFAREVYVGDLPPLDS